MRRSVIASTSVVLLLAGIFGIFDARLQDSGSNHAFFWISNMSSAYLVLAFLAGRVVARRRHAAGLAVVLGLTATVVALSSFYAWQVAEGHFPPVVAETQLHRWVLAGVFSGPLFGWLGYRWGLHRSWYAAGAVVAALVLEPYAWREHLGFTPAPAWVWSAEQLVGVAVAAFFVVQAVRYLRDRRTVRTS